MKSVKTGMEDVGLQWNPKKCVNFERGTHVADSAGLKVDGNAKISSLEDRQQYKFFRRAWESEARREVNFASAAKGNRDGKESW